MQNNKANHKILKQIPNLLSIIRLLLIPLIVILIFKSRFLLAIIIYTISSITDIVDGFIARKFNFVSDLGKLLDPLADKLTQICTIASLVFNSIIQGWILVIIVVKELIMIMGASFLYGKNVVVYSKWYGKLATCLLYLAIVLSLIIKFFELNSNIWRGVNLALYVLAIACTIFALVMYVITSYKKGFINKEDIDKAVKIPESK